MQAGTEGVQGPVCGHRKRGSRDVTWAAYHLPPIDMRWEMLDTIEEVLVKFARMDAQGAMSGEGSELAGERFLADFDEAKELAKSIEWEGDFRHEPRIFWLPAEEVFRYAFVWKQDNNGSTFVVSPFELSWLDAIKLDI